MSKHYNELPSLNWRYIKPLIDESCLDEFKQKTGFSFPDEYIECIKVHNGGRPDKILFETDAGKERCLKTLLSLNHGDRETIWNYLLTASNSLASHLAFAIDNFGNIICFRTADKAIIFVNLEDLSEEFVASDFESFLRALH